MSVSTPPHVVVVGRGIAGAYTAWAFRKRGCHVSWWGDARRGASHVAAGMFNPVSFRRIVEVWNAEAHLKTMRATLQEMERTLGLEGRVLHDVPVLKVLANEDYRLTWDSRWEEGHGVCQWATPSAPSPSNHVHAPHGVGRVHAAGWVDLPLLLRALEALWADEGRLVNRSWEVADGVPEGADWVVDCRGVGASEELAQGGLKVQPNHGDVLTVSTPGTLGLNTAGCNVNNGKWLLPMGVRGERMWWRLGATYGWAQTTPEPSPDAQEELLAHMAQAWTAEGRSAWEELRVEAHQSGLRPASPDRRPMVGPWPGQPSGVAMLNGLGTRGVLVGAAASDALVAWCLDGQALPGDIDPRRFKGFKK